MLTKEMLEQYTLLGRELERIENKIDYYSHITVFAEHGVVKGSMKDFPYAETHFVLSGSDIQKDDALQDKIKQLLITLTQKRQELLEYSLVIECELESIPDIEMRQILEYHYIQGLSYREIGKKIHVDYSAISRKVNLFFANQLQNA